MNKGKNMMYHSNVYKAMKAIAEGYKVQGINDRYVMVENPDWKNPCDDPYIVVDIKLYFDEGRDHDNKTTF